MKRFYCTICRKVKRVQKWPDDVQAYTSINVFDRMGTCNYHTMGRVVHVSTRVRPSKPAKVVAPIQQKRKRA